MNTIKNEPLKSQRGGQRPTLQIPQKVINIANNGSNSARTTLSLGATNGRIIKLK